MTEKLNAMIWQWMIQIKRERKGLIYSLLIGTRSGRFPRPSLPRDW
jgi:hypothetical protein